MRLIEKIKEITHHLTQETAQNKEDSELPEKKKTGSVSDHGFMEAVKEEIGAPKEGEALPHEVTVEELYQDLNRRKQKGEMPRNPMEALMDALGRRPASEVYASRAVFDLSHLYRDHFIKALQAPDDRKLFDLFRATYSLFMDQPEVVGLKQEMINRKNEDTDPTKWQVSRAATENGDPVALCRMPIQNKTLSDRLTGIVFRDSGDEYYFCMLNKDEQIPSEVMRNTGSLPMEKAGTLQGTDAEAINRFLECIKGKQ